MLFSNAVAVFLAASLSFAAPVEKRVTTPMVNDAIILNYALTLEYLERKFYQEGLANYTQAQFVAAGFADPFYTNLKEIYFDEQTHVDFISGALKAANLTPTVELQYTFGVTDPKSFVTLSSVLEGVGVSAYTGAAASIMNKDYLTAAASILSVEARHAAYIRSSNGESPFPNPFDTPLDFNQVFSLAAPFITGGSSPVTLPFMAFPKLMPQCMGTYQSGSSSITFTNAFTNAQTFDQSITANTPIYAVFFSGLMKLPVQVSCSGSSYAVQVPQGVSGQSYVLLSRSSTDFSDENVIAGPAIIEVIAMNTGTGTGTGSSSSSGSQMMHPMC